MKELNYDVTVIGAGPAGLAAAGAAKRNGAEKVLIVERDTDCGGILQQCIHSGFGLTYFNEELTGPEYASRFIKSAREKGVDILLDTMALSVDQAGIVVCSNPQDGIVTVRTKAVVLAMGCRERTRANLRIPGTRPAGIYTAGTAQRLINRQNEMVGREVVILGSGDIGMIMARRLTLEGAKVKAVVEIMDYLAGLTRNRVQCLDDFGIPLLLRHTVTRIHGNRRVEAVTVCEVDQNRKPILSTAQDISCDTLLLSVGLIPENELTRACGIAIDPVTNGPSVNQFMQTSVSRVFACGNVVHVNDLVDNVSQESEKAGASAALYAQGKLPEAASEIPCAAGEGIRYVCPQTIVPVPEGGVRLCFRVLRPGKDVTLTALQGDEILTSKKARRVSPGEMEHLDIDMAKLTGEGIRIVAKEAVSV